MAVSGGQGLLGLFTDANAVADAIDGLRAAGFAGNEIKTLTDVPYPDGAFGEDPEPHKLYVFPFVGAMCGFSVGLFLTAGTQLVYPMVTGGKPVLSIPPMVNIMYEGTMLGAILFTILGILFESRLPNFAAAPYDTRISEGYIGVLITRANGRSAAAERALRDAGAVDIVTRSEGGH